MFKAAGCLIFANDTNRILLQYRSNSVSNGNCWGTWGGEMEKGETPEQTVIRELNEESGYNGDIKLIPLKNFESKYIYYNFLGIVPKEFTPKLNIESDKAKWFDYYNLPNNLHFGLNWLLNQNITHKTITMNKNKNTPINEIFNSLNNFKNELEKNNKENIKIINKNKVLKYLNGKTK
jgi:8-oxo-dGTP pyrophosphatase MutT (NUDIX family)